MQNLYASITEKSILVLLTLFWRSDIIPYKIKFLLEKTGEPFLIPKVFDSYDTVLEAKRILDMKYPHIRHEIVPV